MASLLLGTTIGGNTAIHTGNISSYALTGSVSQLVSPNGATVVAADSAMPSAGHSFIHTLGLSDGNDGHILAMSWANTTSVYGAQIFIDTDPTDTMRIRSRANNGAWTSWKTIIHSGTIGSQSVNYATTAGSAPANGGTSTHTYRGIIEDTRAAQRTPNDYEDYRVSWEFTNQMPHDSNWLSVMTMQGWHDGYAAWQIMGTATTTAYENWYLRSGVNGTWNPARTIIHSGNIGSQSVSYATSAGNSVSTDQTNFSALFIEDAPVATKEYVTSQGYLTSLPSHTHDDRYYTESESDNRYVPYGSITGSFGLNDNKLYLRTNGDNNHYLWNAGDDWEELVYYTGTGFRVKGSTGVTAATFTDSGINLPSGSVAQFYTAAGSLRGYIQATDTDDNHFIIATSGGEDIVFKDGGLAGERNMVIRGNAVVESYGDFRAPIFYDSNDTGYYVDPNSTSNLNYLNLGNTREEFPFLRMGANGRYALGVSGAYTRLSSHNQGSGVQLGYYDGTTFTPRLTVSNDGNVVAESSFRAPIFYDSNDTGYYVDPNSISRLWGVAIRGDAASTGTSNQIFFWGAGDSTTSAIGFKANGGYFENPTGSGDGYNTYFTMDSDGRGWVFRRGVGGSDFGAAYTSGWILNNGIWQANASMRAPIFYDSQDTAFYVDPNSASRVRNLYVGDSGSNWSDPGGWGTQFHVSNGPHSIIRVYARNEGIETIMYSHVGGQSKVGSGTNHDFSIVRNFSDRMTFYSGYTYANGYLQAADSLRAPIFYDSNDTGYYVDPNSTSRMYQINYDYLYYAPDTNYGFQATNVYADTVNSGYNNDPLELVYYRGSEVRVGSDGGNKDIRAARFVKGTDTTYFLDPNADLSLRVYGEICNSNYAEGKMQPGALNIGRIDTNYAWDGGSWAGDVRLGILANTSETWEFGIHDSGDSVMSVVHFDGGSTLTMGRNLGWGQCVVNAPAGYVSNSNPWGTANSAFFPNGITTAGGTNWIYGFTYIGNAPGNGNGHEFNANGTQYSTTSITTPTFIVNNHSDNTKGYRIHNTSGTTVSAMFVNSSNQLVIAAGAVDQVNLNKKVLVNGVALGVNVAPSATAGRIDASNDIVAYSSSDERLKENIAPIENALDKVKSLTGVEFDWKPEYKHAHGYEGHDTGIIAQQVQAVMPSAVRTNETGFLAVRYEKLIGLLVEANKELAARVEELEKKIG